MGTSGVLGKRKIFESHSQFTGGGFIYCQKWQRKATNPDIQEAPTSRGLTFLLGKAWKDSSVATTSWRSIQSPEKISAKCVMCNHTQVQLRFGWIFCFSLVTTTRWRSGWVRAQKPRLVASVLNWNGPTSCDKNIKYPVLWLVWSSCCL